MTREEIIALAREVGIDVYEGDQDRILWDGSIVDALGRMVGAAAIKEREACAQVCERIMTGGIQAYAAAIRARGD